MDQPGKVPNLARGQLNRENEYSSVPARAWEFGLTRGSSTHAASDFFLGRGITGMQLL